ncbi:MAG: hypothetical protein CO189_01895 [candidate division Zixibacteria bacterium CG_4_9_14_3_um_filter_46_8]|nr:MAG: hypothetical protein CO189_01895 [candidate division Zixibacteria bacterium CG_4_9_14_3_um_filter_46_8]
MDFKKAILVIGVGVIICLAIFEAAFAIRPREIIRDENGNEIRIPPPGEPGIDFKADQFIARLKNGYLDMPNGGTDTPLYQCEVDNGLFNLLTEIGVISVIVFSEIANRGTPSDMFVGVGFWCRTYHRFIYFIWRIV